MESLSQEILDLIIPHLFEVPPIKNPTPGDPKPVLNIAQYAMISRKWQNAVERFTMADIKKYSTDLDMFCQVFSSPRRRNFLRKLDYEIDLPTYSKNRIFCLERKRGFSVPITIYRSLRIANGGRSLHPSAIGKIIASMPSLERLTLELNAPNAKRAEIQNDHRLCLANALESPSLSNLRTLNIDTYQGIPCNHNFKNRPDDPKYPDGDVLNAAIRKLAEKAHLKCLNLTGDWLVSPALFNGEKTFPYLERVQIQGALITYDGRWYYTGDPNAVEANYELPRDDDYDDNDSDSNSSFNSEFHDSLPERREALLNGNEPYYTWRTQPDPQMFDSLMKALATAILRMPSLQNLLFSMGMSSMFYHGITFECLKPGEHPEWSEYPRKTVELDTTRCYVTLMPEARWNVPGDVATLWKEIVEDKGVVAVEAFSM